VIVIAARGHMATAAVRAEVDLAAAALLAAGAERFQRVPRLKSRPRAGLPGRIVRPTIDTCACTFYGLTLPDWRKAFTWISRLFASCARCRRRNTCAWDAM
jgi:hypothetical protein